ncbi:flavin reductase family protein [Georgenia daeguensis]|uniref:Flavin reductase family protein n=1 Tax=Georgenia daeguensis TaxID=908355 RepID=A0ABP8EYD8_9MICO
MTVECLADRRAGAAAMTPENFKAVFRNHPAGVAVVTLRGPEGPVGFTATSVASVSAAPPVLAFSLAAASSSRPALERAGSVVVNFLAEDQRDVAEAFARRGVDRFGQVAWSSLPTGEPVLRGVRAWVRGVIEERIPVGDSLLVTVRAALSDRQHGTRPLVYLDRAYHRLGDHSLSE